MKDNDLNPKALQKLVQAEIKDEFEAFEKRQIELFDVLHTDNENILKKLTTIETEVAAFSGGQKRQDDDLADHDTRLNTVERHVGFKPADQKAGA